MVGCRAEHNDQRRKVERPIVRGGGGGRGTVYARKGVARAAVLVGGAGGVHGPAAERPLEGRRARENVRRRRVFVQVLPGEALVERDGVLEDRRHRGRRLERRQIQRVVERGRILEQRGKRELGVERRGDPDGRRHRDGIFQKRVKENGVGRVKVNGLVERGGTGQKARKGGRRRDVPAGERDIERGRPVKHAVEMTPGRHVPARDVGVGSRLVFEEMAKVGHGRDRPLGDGVRNRCIVLPVLGKKSIVDGVPRNARRLCNCGSQQEGECHPSFFFLDCIRRIYAKMVSTLAGTSLYSQ